MRSLRHIWLAIAALTGAASMSVANAQDTTAAQPHDLSVTIYRDPYRGEGGFNLRYLNGFALITETRRVVLQPGDQRLRFEGVADGIEPASAIVTGLPSGVIEKNRDAMLLSPSALVEAAAEQSGRVSLVRTNPVTGVTTRTPGTIRSGASGVVFETEQGIESLRCTGFAESFAFEASTTGLSATPTLSIRTRVTQPVEAVVQLSYLARGFDWSADYVVDTQPNSRINLGGWITLANSNGVSFPNARVQIVAGKLNRQTGQVDPIDFGQPILAQCWPSGTTSDVNTVAYIEKFSDDIIVTGSRARPVAAMAPPPPPPTPPPPAPAAEAQQENLGDLKLYRVPNRSSILARQAKQVRLMDRAAIPVKRVYEAELYVNQTNYFRPPKLILRTKNDKQNNLGLPLPAGRVQLFETTGRGQAARRLLAGQTNLRDLALDEEVEFEFNAGADIQVQQIYESAEVSQDSPVLRIVPGFIVVGRQFNQVSRIEVTNARNHPVDVEVRLTVPFGTDIARADRTIEMKNGRPIFRLTVPANQSVTVRYQTSPQPTQ